MTRDVIIKWEVPGWSRSREVGVNHMKSFSLCSNNFTLSDAEWNDKELLKCIYLKKLTLPHQRPEIKHTIRTWCFKSVFKRIAKMVFWIAFTRLKPWHRLYLLYFTIIYHSSNVLGVRIHGINIHFSCIVRHLFYHPSTLKMAVFCSSKTLVTCCHNPEEEVQIFIAVKTADLIFAPK
jgi:hypothetical protein